MPLPHTLPRVSPLRWLCRDENTPFQLQRPGLGAGRRRVGGVEVGPGGSRRWGRGEGEARVVPLKGGRAPSRSGCGNLAVPEPSRPGSACGLLGCPRGTGAGEETRPASGGRGPGCRAAGCLPTGWEGGARSPPPARLRSFEGGGRGILRKSGLFLGSH